MNVVQKIIEVSQKIGTVQEFYEFSEGMQRCLSVIKLIVTLKTTLKHSGKLFLIHMRIIIFQGTFFLTSP